MAVGHYYLDSDKDDVLTIYLHFDGMEYYFDPDGWGELSHISYSNFCLLGYPPINKIEGKDLNDIKLKIETLFPEIKL